MKTFISAALLSLMLMGCGSGTDKILASQEETNAKIDSLISFLNEPRFKLSKRTSRPATLSVDFFNMKQKLPIKKNN